MKQESRVGFSSSFPADSHLSFHYTSLVDLNNRRAADELSGFVRWSLPWSRAEGAEGRIPSQQIHILCYVASFETGTCPGSTRWVTLTIGISAPLRPTNRLWSKFSLWIACKHWEQMQAKATCIVCAMTWGPFHPTAGDIPVPPGAAKGNQTSLDETTQFSVACYKPTHICSSCGCVVFLTLFLLGLFFSCFVTQFLSSFGSINCIMQLTSRYIKRCVGLCIVNVLSAQGIKKAWKIFFALFAELTFQTGPPAMGPYSELCIYIRQLRAKFALHVHFASPITSHLSASLENALIFILAGLSLTLIISLSAAKVMRSKAWI